MQLDPEALRTFVLVVDASSMSAAARALRVTTNAVSRRVARLEDETGSVLLHRTTRAAALTEEGRRLYAHAKRLLQLLDEIDHDLKPRRQRVEGTVRVAVPASALDEDFLQHVATTLDAHPGLAMQLLGTNGPIDPIADAVDIEIFVGTPPNSSRPSRPLGHVWWVMAASPRYLENHGVPGKPADLASHECLRLLSDRPQDRWHLTNLDGQKASVPVGGRFECNDSRALGEAVYAGLGIGVRPEREVVRASGRLVRVLPDWHFGPQPLFLLRAPRRSRLPRVGVVAQVLQDALRDRLAPPSRKR